jgi:hypothetical protein
MDARDSIGQSWNRFSCVPLDAHAHGCRIHAIAGGGRLVLDAQAGEGRLAELFRKAGFTRFRRATGKPFNLILEARR